MINYLELNLTFSCLLCWDSVMKLWTQSAVTVLFQLACDHGVMHIWDSAHPPTRVCLIMRVFKSSYANEPLKGTDACGALLLLSLLCANSDQFTPHGSKQAPELTPSFSQNAWKSTACTADVKRSERKALVLKEKLLCTDGMFWARRIS